MDQIIKRNQICLFHFHVEAEINKLHRRHKVKFRGFRCSGTMSLLCSTNRETRSLPDTEAAGGAEGARAPPSNKPLLEI
jgi:hypothetical protein